MAKKFYNQSRREKLLGLIETFNKKEIRGNRAPLSPSAIEKQASTSWNSYQKTVSSIQKQIKQQPWQMKKIHEQQARGVVHQFNKIIEENHLQMSKISFDDIKKNSYSWNAFQSTMAAYRKITKKGATAVVGYTPSGIPVYKWQQDIITDKLSKINKQRRDILKQMQFSPYAGTVFSTEYYALQPKPNPVKTLKTQYEIGQDIKSIIKQAAPGYEDGRLAQYKANFLSAASHINNPEIRDELTALVNSMSDAEFYASFAGDPLISIDFIYEEKSEFNTYDQRGLIALSHLRRHEIYAT